MALYQLESKNAKAIANTLGGQLVSYISDNGREYLYNDVCSHRANYSHILFPLVGTAKEDKVKFYDIEYHIQKHGLYRRSKTEFQLVTHGADFVEFFTQSTHETLLHYPFHYSLNIRHTISNTGFTTSLTVKNESDKPMPLCLGFHPYFACPIVEGENFEDYFLKFEYSEQAVNLLSPSGDCIQGSEVISGFYDTDILLLNRDLFDSHDALILSQLKSKKVKLLSSKTGKGIELDYNNFDTLVIWTPPGENAPFLCLEPCCGLPAFENETGNFEDKPFVKWIYPHKYLKKEFSVTVIE